MDFAWIFYTLFPENTRGDCGRFINVTLASKVDAMLAHEDRHTDRMMDDADIKGLFGV